jgi:hypothetical protein
MLGSEVTFTASRACLHARHLLVRLGPIELSSINADAVATTMTRGLSPVNQFNGKASIYRERNKTGGVIAKLIVTAIVDGASAHTYARTDAR